MRSPAAPAGHNGIRRLSTMNRSLTRWWALGSRLPAPIRRGVNALPGVAALRTRAMQAPGGPNPQPGALRPVVYLPTWAQWDVMRQRPQFLLAAFAASGHDVYFVDPRETAPRVCDGVSIVPDLVAVPGRSPILYIHYAPLIALAERFGDPVILYDILDDISIYAEDERGVPASRRVSTHHPRALARADVVTASAAQLQRRNSGTAGVPLLVPNGVDVARFANPRRPPADLPVPSGARIGYHGAIAPWLDFALIEAIAVARPADQIVMVGPVLDGAADQVRVLERHDNVWLLGERPPDEIASYVQAFDVGLVPFVVNQMTEAVSPLKMYEYLAAGLPVVATRLPECVAHPLVRTARADGFLAELTLALEEGPTAEYSERARIAAQEASWGNRIAMIRDRLADIDRLRV